MPKLRTLIAAALATLALTGASACATDEADGSSGPVDTSLEPSRGAAPATITVDASTTVIDVRTPEEFASGHLDGAVNIDLSAADFDDRIAALDPSAAYVVYCRSGSRSAQAAARMADLGFDDVLDAGGLEQAARASGLAIVD